MYDYCGRVSISDFCVMDNGTRVDYLLAQASESPVENSDPQSRAIDNADGEGILTTKWGNNGITGNGLLFSQRGCN